MVDNNLLNAFLSMGAIVLILIAILFVLKRIAKKKQIGGNNIDMKIVSRLQIQHKSQLAIVEVDGKKLLLGLTEQNVNLLADLSDDKTFIEKNDTIEKIFPTSNAKLQESMKKVSKSNDNLSNDLSFSAFLKSTFTKK